MPTYLSIVEMPGNGVQEFWDFNFAGGYIEQAHVKAEVEDAAGVITPLVLEPADFITSTRIQVTPPVPTGSTIRIYRDTPREEPLVDFTGGSNFTEANLDILAQQAIFAGAEARDFADRSVEAATNAAQDASDAAALANSVAASVPGIAASTATAVANARVAEETAAIRQEVRNIAALFNPRGAWATGTAYSAGSVGAPTVPRDVVFGPDSLPYAVLVSHTSGVFATDVSAGRLLQTDSAQVALTLAGQTGAESVAYRRTDLPGSQSTTLGFHIRKDRINIARDFNLAPGADITSAMQTAMVDGRRIYLPGTPTGDANDWLVSAALPLASYDQVIEGDGWAATRIRQITPDAHIFTNGAFVAQRVRLNGMWLKAVNGLGSPLYFPTDGAKAMYNSRFSNLVLSADQRNALHVGAGFQITVEQCWAESNGGHAFFVNGGNTTYFENCYALKCGPGKAAYRSPGGGQFNSCNSLNGGSHCFWFASGFGGPTDAWDPNTNAAVPFAQLINCNMESFTGVAIRNGFSGWVNVIGGKIGGNTTLGYVTHVLAEGPCTTKFYNVRRDPIGFRVADASLGLPTPALGDFVRTAVNGRFHFDDEQQMVYTTAGAGERADTNQYRAVGLTLTFAGSTVAGTNALTSACFTKQTGDSQQVWGRLTLTAKDAAASGDARFVGLPVNGRGTSQLPGAGVVARYSGITLTAGYTQLGVEVPTGANHIELWQSGSGLAPSKVNVSQVAVNAQIDFSIGYVA